MTLLELEVAEKPGCKAPRVVSEAELEITSALKLALATLPMETVALFDQLVPEPLSTSLPLAAALPHMTKVPAMTLPLVTFTTVMAPAFREIVNRVLTGLGPLVTYKLPTAI